MDSSESPRSSTTLFACLLLALGLTSAWKEGSKGLAIDAYQFWAVGREIQKPGVAEIYSEPARARIGRALLEEARSSGDPGLITVAEKREFFETYSRRFSTPPSPGLPERTSADFSPRTESRPSAALPLQD